MRWDLCSVQTWNCAYHDHLCREGWEPFAVHDDRVWFRRLIEAA